MTTEYSFDQNAASEADKVSSRIDETGMYKGVLKNAVAVISSNKGTHGVELDFESSDGNTTIMLWTKSAEGEPYRGFNQVQAIMAILGLRGLKSVAGKRRRYDFDEKKEVEEDAEVFPELLEKPLIFALQKHWQTAESGKDFYNMELFAIFHPETRLTSTEMKERKNTPAKFEKISRTLKTKDGRKKKGAEPGQPAMGGDGGY